MKGSGTSENRIKMRTLAAELRVVLISALFIFGVAATIATAFIMRSGARESEIRESETLISTVAGSINAGMGNYKDISRLIMLNDKVVKFLRLPGVDANLTYDARAGVFDVLNVSNHLDSCFIYRNDGYFLSTGRAEYNVDYNLMNDDTWRNTILDRRGGAVVMMNAGGAITRKNGNNIITIARAIYDIQTQERSGLLLLNISTNMLDALVNLQSGSGLCILTDEGVPLSGDASLSEYFEKNATAGDILHHEYRIDGKRRMVSSYTFPDLPLAIVCVSSEARHTIPTSYLVVLGILLLALVITLTISIGLISRRITRPILALVKAMEQAQESGHMEKLEARTPHNEIGTLVTSYNSLIDSLNELFTRLLEKEKSVRRSEMRVLTEQIKPHFLYNSIATISYMSYEAGAMKVYQALETLANFYRNFLSKGDRNIPVKKEVAIVRDYLALQKLRYGDILSDEYDIAPDVEQRMMPKLLLQPLVENCIYHGIRPKGDPGVIRISARLEDGDIVLSVYDTGLGMSPEQIDQVLTGEGGTPAEESGSGSGFGLKGTIDRIRYYCGREDVVTIESEPGEYTRITFRVPDKTAEPEEE
ncbi:MAG: sensor histidine kinase [Lachnospiraceae bacterium]|nr:sensor histidine kinase [Lachnospiraceae bacterium]